MHIRCPVCEHSIQALTLRKREEHCVACLENIDVPAKKVKVEETITELGGESAELPFQEPTIRDSSILDAKESEPGTQELTYKESTGTIPTFTECRTTERELIKQETTTQAAQISERTFRDQNFPETAVELKPLTENVATAIKGSRAKQEQKTPRVKNIPFYKTMILNESKIAVDAFNYGAIPGVNSYFLSHFHSDHYGGLSKRWAHGDIYCSLSTARLVELKLNVSPKFLKPLEMNRKYTIEGNDVILLDANHCPGAVVFLFNERVLHTGDFRATNDLIYQIKKWTPRLDTVYLDTTYLDPQRKFPSQDLVVHVCANYCHNFQQLPMPRNFFTKTPDRRRVLALVGTYTIGKERLAVAIANKLNTKIWCTSYKRTIIETLSEPSIDPLLWDNGYEAQVHLTSMSELTIPKLEQSWAHLRKYFTHLVAFIPTGWTWPAKSTEFTEKSLENTKTSTVRSGGSIRICRVPYSEHSSFTELENFCNSIDCAHIIATVPTKRHDILQSWEKM